MLRACEYAGVTPRTVERWRKAGSRGDAPDDLVALVVAIKKAKADFVFNNMSTITEASIASWQAAAWLLERTQPEFFAKRDEELFRKLKEQVATLTAIVGEKLKEATKEAKVPE